jgi:hypothetical protein
VFKCDYLFDCRLEFKDIVLREMFGGKVERLTGGWRKLQWALGEWDLWCMLDFSEKRKLVSKVCLTI